MTTVPEALTSGPAQVRSIDPATGETWRVWTSTTPEEVQAAVLRAREAQPAWAAGSLGERRRIFRRVRRRIFERRAELAALIQREAGKPAVEAMTADVLTTLDVVRFCERRAPRLLRARTMIPSNVALWRKRVTIEHEPYGVIGIISPWNYPLFLPASGTLAALVAGNAVVLKPSELTPATAVRFGELLHESGVPKDVMQVLPGDGATGAALTDASIDKLFFTGSVTTGRKVALACAARLVPYALELGGSDPAIVLEDADLETAASGILWGRFSNAGQTCVAPKRVIVANAVHDAFVDRITTAAAQLVMGSGAAGSDVGPMIRPSQLDALESQLRDARQRGAHVVSHGRGDRHFFAPTIVSNVSSDMRIAREETFGPLLAIIRAHDDAEAIAIANDTPFGLSASIWSRDLTRARGIAARIAAGTVQINDALSVVGMADVPHGGVKESGTGRLHGEAGLRECVREKAIVVDPFPSWRQPWWFGYGAEHARNIDAFARFSHGRTVLERLSGAWRSIKMLVSRERPL
ncbi:MAG TPA: aldehyde dehydrogenase family protein [Gemmatimonadaceae bacterium]|nr:aldehyde dehydrogenase family protein [Gemmatimonadaceae bacterium]